MKLAIVSFLAILICAGCGRSEVEVRGQIVLTSTSQPMNNSFMAAEAQSLDAVGQPLLTQGDKLHVLAIRGTTLLEARVSGDEGQRVQATAKKILDAYIATPRADLEAKVVMMPTLPHRLR